MYCAVGPSNSGDIVPTLVGHGVKNFAFVIAQELCFRDLQFILSFSLFLLLFLLLFMGFIVLFSTIHSSYYIITISFNFYLQYF